MRLDKEQRNLVTLYIVQERRGAITEQDLERLGKMLKEDPDELREYLNQVQKGVYIMKPAATFRAKNLLSAIDPRYKRLLEESITLAMMGNSNKPLLMQPPEPTLQSDEEKRFREFWMVY